jgi:hypothetical protein
MAITETMNYHANHIGAIRTNKERLKKIYNVDIIITRRRYGEYQEIDIMGSTKDIRTVKSEIQVVVDKAEFDYQEFLKRKRQRESKRPYAPFKLPPQIVTTEKHNINPFAALEDLDENEPVSYETEYPTITINPNVSWGDLSDDEE